MWSILIYIIHVHIIIQLTTLHIFPTVKLLGNIGNYFFQKVQLPVFLQEKLTTHSYMRMSLPLNLHKNNSYIENTSLVWSFWYQYLVLSSFRATIKTKQKNPCIALPLWNITKGVTLNDIFTITILD